MFRRRRITFLDRFQLAAGRSDDDDEEMVDAKIELEERKLLVAQRKLESIRLLDELLERVKVNATQLPEFRTLVTTLARPRPCLKPDHGLARTKKSSFRFRSKMMTALRVGIG
jgi:hypothetical protein